MGAGKEEFVGRDADGASSRGTDRRGVVVARDTREAAAASRASTQAPAMSAERNASIDARNLTADQCSDERIGPPERPDASV